MRYRGQIRFPDVDTGDLDVSVEVDDTHVRILAGGKSLGRWCLADVVADRVVANEFELDLDGEVVRFLAEDQINFAYGAVQAMAEGWARYQSMNFVKRSRAVSSGRKANEPSRLREAHHAFVMAREALGDEEADLAASPDESHPEAESSGEETVAEKRTSRFRRRHLAESEPPEREPAPARGPEQEFPEMPAPAEEEGAGAAGVSEPAAPSPPALIPPPPVVEPEPEPPVSPVPESAPPSAQPSLSERLAQARAAAETAAEPPRREPSVLPRKVPRIDTFPGRGASGAERRTAKGDSGAARRPVAEPPTEAAPVDRDGGPEQTKKHLQQRAVPPRPEAEEETKPSVEVEIPSGRGSAEGGASPESEGPGEPEAAGPDPGLVAPGVGSSDPVVDGREGSRSDSAQVGGYADGHHPAETSGLRASLRSVFSRSKTEPHEHSYVESTTAVGLTRKVCIECGHVSIGVSD